MRDSNADIQKKLCLIFFIVVFISDFITKISIVYFDGFLERLVGVVKLIFEFIMLFYLFKKGKINQILFLGLILSIAFLISNGSIIIQDRIDYSSFLNNIYWFNRYLYIFIFIAFLKLNDVRFSVNDDFVKLFKTVLYINSVLIMIGFFFKIELFRSYAHTPRFGYDGIFTKHGEAVYYYMFFICILYFEYTKNKTTNNVLKIIAISAVSVSMGKKAILLFLFLLTINHIFFISKKGKTLGYLLLSLIAGLIFFRKAVLSTFFALSPYWEDQYQSYGFMGMLTSIRSEFLIDFVNYIQLNWNIFNYLFGMGAYSKYKVEFEFVDVFMFFGLTGIVIFIYLFKKYFYEKSNIISTYLLLSILITSFFSGALFISVTGMMFFYIVFQWINSSEVTPI